MPSGNQTCTNESPSLGPTPSHPAPPPPLATTARTPNSTTMTTVARETYVERHHPCSVINCVRVETTTMTHPERHLHPAPPAPPGPCNCQDTDGTPICSQQWQMISLFQLYRSLRSLGRANLRRPSRGAGRGGREERDPRRRLDGRPPDPARCARLDLPLRRAPPLVLRRGGWIPVRNGSPAGGGVSSCGYRSATAVAVA